MSSEWQMWVNPSSPIACHTCSERSTSPPFPALFAPPQHQGSFPALVTMYLFTAIRAASRASEVNCWSSSQTKCAAAGNSSQGIFFFPQVQGVLGGGHRKEKEAASKDKNWREDPTAGARLKLSKQRAQGGSFWKSQRDPKLERRLWGLWFCLSSRPLTGPYFVHGPMEMFSVHGCGNVVHLPRPSKTYPCPCPSSSLFGFR